VDYDKFRNYELVWGVSANSFIFNLDSFLAFHFVVLALHHSCFHLLLWDCLIALICSCRILNY